MSSKYPNELDTNAEIPSVSDNITETGSESINGLIDAVFAVQRALGANPQGGSANLTARLSEALNDDGTLKASALVAAGLISLPVTNSQVGASAAIEESKLDLDVGTQSLQNQISANDVDIATLQNQLATQISRVTRHVLGLAERHDSNQIDHSLIDGYSAGFGSTLEEAVDFIYGAFLTHRAATTDPQHNASAIVYEPQTVGAGESPIITATTVQGAIDQFDDQFVEDRRKHNDSAHSDGVSKDGYLYEGGQAAVNDASLKLTRYTTDSGPQIIKLGLCNSAVVKSKGFTQNSITASANSLVVTVDIGTESRSITLTDIHLGGANEGVYPSGSGHVSLRGIVDSFNAQFAASRFPVTAFESDDGELVLQHNIARNDCTITLTNPGSNPAGTELGFGDVLGVEVFRQEVYRFHVNGTPFTELKTIGDGYVIQGSSSSVVDLGVDVTSSGLDLRNNQLFHIYSHSAASGESGTYRIVSSSGTSVTLDTTVDAGTLNWIIYDDVPDTNFSGNPRTIDVYIDSSRNTVSSVRASVTSSQMSGLLSMVEVSQDFPADVGSTLALTKSGTTYSLVLTVDSVAGQATLFQEDFVGDVLVYGPDNVSFVRLTVVDGLAPAPRTDTITFTETEFQDDRLLLGTNHVRSGGSVVEVPKDRRNVGLVGNSAIGSEFIEGVLERDIANLHLSGVVRGFDVVSNTTTDLVLNGGAAYINGKFVSLTRRTVDVTNVASTVGTWNLVLTADATLEIFDNANSGYTLAEALRTDAFIVLAQITITSGPVIDAVTDTRFFINDIDSRLQLTVDDRDLGAGSFRNLEAAVLYSGSAPNDTKPEIVILSDETLTDSFTVGTGSRIVAYNDLTFNNDLTLSSGSELEIFGSLTVSGQTFLQSGAKIICRGSSTFTGTLDMGANSILELDGACSASIIQISGDDIKLLGSVNQPTITFAGSADGIQTSGTRSGITIKDLDLSMTASTNSIMAINATASNIIIENCQLSQDTTLTSGQLVNARSGLEINSVTVTNLKVKDTTFTNLGFGVYCNNATINDFVVLSSTFSSIGTSFSIFSGERLMVSDSSFLSTHDIVFFIEDTVQDFMISGCWFSGEFTGSSTPTPILSDGTTNNCIIEGNTFADFSGGNIIRLSDGSGIVISDNTILDCSTTSEAVSMGGIAGPGVFANNTIVGHTGELLRANSTAIIGNTLSSSGAASGTSIELQSSSIASQPFVGNRIVVSDTSDSASIRNYSMSGNYIEIGSVTIEEGSKPFVVTGNEFNLINTSASNNLILSNSSASGSVFSNNIVTGVGITTAILLNDGTYNFTGNLVDGSGCARAVTVGNNSTSASNIYQVSDNYIIAGTAYAFYVDASNSKLTGNLTTGSVSSDDTLVTASKTNIFIANNFSNTSGVGGGRIRHTDSAPTNVFIGLNKNAASQKVYSTLNGLQTNGAWTSSVSLPSTIELVSSTSNDQLVVPISNLPTGAQLVSVALLADTPGSAGTLTIRLFRRQASSGTTVTEIASSASNLSSIYQTITVTPTSAEYVSQNVEYLLYIESTAASNSIGQVVATFNY